MTRTKPRVVHGLDACGSYTGRGALIFYARQTPGYTAGVRIAGVTYQLKTLTCYNLSMVRTRYMARTTCINYVLSYTGACRLLVDAEGRGMLVGNAGG